MPAAFRQVRLELSDKGTLSSAGKQLHRTNRKCSSLDVFDYVWGPLGRASCEFHGYNPRFIALSCISAAPASSKRRFLMALSFTALDGINVRDAKTASPEFIPGKGHCNESPTLKSRTFRWSTLPMMWPQLAVASVSTTSARDTVNHDGRHENVRISGKQTGSMTSARASKAENRFKENLFISWLLRFSKATSNIVKVAR